jgi:hypothetical protein
MEQVVTHRNSESFPRSIEGHDERRIFCFHILMISRCYVSWNVNCFIRGCIQKFPDLVDNEICAYLCYHSLGSNIKGYGGKTH